jgi:DDE superfamily endonuclease
LIRAIEKYNLTAENIYNWDEKGFLIGLCRALKRIMTRQAYESGRVKQAVQDGSREFISLLACVSAIGRRLPAALIYKGEGFDLQDTWVEDLEDTDEAYFGASSNGWSNDAFGLKWLVQVFDRHTHRLAGHRRRLLIVDGHSSHVNMAFLNKCDELRILVLILPPHSTHRLQPLDVGLFQPLSTAYSQEVNNFLTKGLGMVSMTKRRFWSLFLPAWEKAFTEDNIKSAFAKAGIWPVDQKRVVDTITRPSTPPPTQIESPHRLKTPLTSKSIRQFQISYRNNPTNEKLHLLFKANERLTAQHAVDEHTKRGLIETVKEEKKKRQRGKKLNLLGEEDYSAQFFSPTTIKRAKDIQAAKVAEAEAEKARIASNKITNAAKKARSDAEKAEKALQRQAVKDAKAQIDAEKKAEKEAQKLANQCAKLASKVTVKKKTTTKTPKKAAVVRKKSVRFVGVAAEGVGPKTPAKVTSTGRCIKTPQRYVHK